MLADEIIKQTITMAPRLMTFVMLNFPAKAICLKAKIRVVRGTAHQIPSSGDLVDRLLVEHLLVIQLAFVHDRLAPFGHINHVGVNVTGGGLRLRDGIQRSTSNLSLLGILKRLGGVRQCMIGMDGHHLGQGKARILHVQRSKHLAENKLLIGRASDPRSCLTCHRIHRVVVDAFCAQRSLWVDVFQQLDELNAARSTADPVQVSARIPLIVGNMNKAEKELASSDRKKVWYRDKSSKAMMYFHIQFDGRADQ